MEKGDSLIFWKRQQLFLVLCVIGAVVGVIVLLPVVQSALLAFAENALLKRKLANTRMWRITMTFTATIWIAICVGLFALIKSGKSGSADMLESVFSRNAKPLGILLIAVFAACTVSFCFMSADIWFDEAWTYSFLTPNLFKIPSVMARLDSHPPLYHLIVKALSLIFGRSVHAMKLYSALPAILFSIIAFCFLSKEFSFRAAAVFELFLLSLGEFSSYCFEIRMYSWAAFFCGLCAIFSFYIIKRGTMKDWLLYILAAVASAYTHLFAALLILCNFIILCVYMFITQPKSRKHIFISALLGVLLYSPWVPVVLSKFTQVSSEGFWIAPLTVKSVIDILKILSPGKSIAGYVGLLFMALLFCVLLLRAVHGMEGRAWLLLCAFSPLAMIFVGVAVSLLVCPLFYPRYALPCIFMLAFAGSLTISSFKGFKFVLSFLLAMLLAAVSLCFTYNQEAKHSKDFKEFMQAVAPHITEETKFVYIKNAREENFGGHHCGIMSILFPKHKHYIEPFLKDSLWQDLFCSEFLPLDRLTFDANLCIMTDDEGGIDSEQKAFVADVLGNESWADAEHALVTPSQYKKCRVYFFDPQG